MKWLLFMSLYTGFTDTIYGPPRTLTVDFVLMAGGALQ